MNYTEQIQQSFYNQRIGTVYGCFEVTDVEYDPEQKRQLWTLRCVHCGLVKQTYNGKDTLRVRTTAFANVSTPKSCIPKNRKKIKRHL